MENKSGINPTLHYLLVLPDEVEKTTKGGLFIPNEAIENKEREMTEGTLVAIGPMGWGEFGDGSNQAEVGDRVCFGKFAGRDMTGKDGGKYVLMNAEDALAVLE